MEAYVTLATNDSYALGAMALGQSLRNTKTTRKLVVLISRGVSQRTAGQLGGLYDKVICVEELVSGDETNLLVLNRPELGVTFSKLHCWRLVEFEKCVFLDADILVLSSLDDLFQYDQLSACPDVGWPDYFNSGLFVFRPSIETFESLISFAAEHGSFDGADQGLLNLYFSDWTGRSDRRIPFVYNTPATALYSYAPALKRNRDLLRAVHFIGPSKPWDLDPLTCSEEFTKLWHDAYSQVGDLELGLEELTISEVVQEGDVEMMASDKIMDRLQQIIKKN